DNREKQLEKVNIQLLEEKQNLQNETQQLQDKLKQENKELQDREKQLKEASSQLEEKQNSQNEIQQSLEQQKLELGEVNSQLKEKQNSQNENQELRNELDQKIKELEFEKNLQSKKEENAQAQAQQSLERISELESNLSMSREQNLSLINEKQNFESEMKVLNKQIKRFQKIISNEKAEPTEPEEDKSENVLQDLNFEIRSLDKILNFKILEYFNEIENLKTQLKNEKQNLNLLKNEKQNSDLLIQQICNENSNLLQQISSLKIISDIEKNKQFPVKKLKDDSNVKKYNKYSNFFGYEITDGKIVAMFDEKNNFAVSIWPTNSSSEAYLQLLNIFDFFNTGIKLELFDRFRPIHANGELANYCVLSCFAENLYQFHKCFDKSRINFIGTHCIKLNSKTGYKDIYIFEVETPNVKKINFSENFEVKSLLIGERASQNSTNEKFNKKKSKFEMKYFFPNLSLSDIEKRTCLLNYSPKIKNLKDRPKSRAYAWFRSSGGEKKDIEDLEKNWKNPSIISIVDQKKYDYNCDLMKHDYNRLEGVKKLFPGVIGIPDEEMMKMMEIFLRLDNEYFQGLFHFLCTIIYAFAEFNEEKNSYLITEEKKLMALFVFIQFSSKLIRMNFEIHDRKKIFLVYEQKIKILSNLLEQKKEEINKNTLLSEEQKIQAISLQETEAQDEKLLMEKVIFIAKKEGLSIKEIKNEISSIERIKEIEKKYYSSEENAILNKLVLGTTQINGFFIEYWDFENTILFFDKLFLELSKFNGKERTKFIYNIMCKAAELFLEKIEIDFSSEESLSTDILMRHRTFPLEDFGMYKDIFDEVFPNN
ncbi:MAG: hypothetical protein LBJ32_01795, partial [Oscillospiraceae bacterium]|nr:hypothetical protein [Oscillospiraceae bacterium]